MWPFKKKLISQLGKSYIDTSQITEPYAKTCINVCELYCKKCGQRNLSDCPAICTCCGAIGDDLGWFEEPGKPEDAEWWPAECALLWHGSRVTAIAKPNGPVIEIGNSE